MSEQQPTLEEQQLMNASELGKLIGRSTKSIRIDIYRRPGTLPPRYQIPGTAKLLWRTKDVINWMEAMAEQMEKKRAEQVKFAREQKIPLEPQKPIHLGARQNAPKIGGGS